MVHVLERLGCVATGATTEEALARTPDAIRAYLGYLRRHGQKADPRAAFDVHLAAHVTAGDFLGRGSSTVLYAPDRAPLSLADHRRYLAWLEWSRADLLTLVRAADAKTLGARPAGRGRSLDEILRHVLESDKDYLYAFLGPVKEAGEPVNAALRDALDLREALVRSRVAAIRRIAALTPAERRASRARGKAVRTARRMLRRMLEHEWEHRREIAERLGRPA